MIIRWNILLLVSALRQQQCKPYVFFVSIGLQEHEKQLNDFASNPALCGKGRVLRDPGGVQLNQLAQNIRPVLVQPKHNTHLPTTKLQSVVPIKTIEPQLPTAIWLLLVLVVFFITLMAICLIQRKTPFELVEDLRNRNGLEGALVVLEPIPMLSEDEEISLIHLHKSKLYLSDLIPVIDKSSFDAELVTVWRAGKKKIDLHCLKGEIFVNTNKINTVELYDEDIIEIGNVKLQFNCIEQQRPFELSSGQTSF